MLGFRWRVGALCAVLTAAVVCFSLQPAGIVTAEDKTDQPSVKGEDATTDQDAGDQDAGDQDAGDQDASSDKAPSSKKTKKKSESNSKKKASKKTTTRKSTAKPSQTPANRGQGAGSSIGRAVGGGVLGGVGGNAGDDLVANSTDGPLPPNDDDGGGNGGVKAGGQAPGANDNNGPAPKEVQRVMDVQNKHTPALMKQEGVVGTATGLSTDGKVFIKVYTSGAGKPVVPEKLDGIEVRAVLSGLIRPFNGSAGLPQYDPKARQARPVPIGTSAFNEDSPACGGSSCSSGTLGCRLKARDGSGLFGLSNNHVFANLNAATPGNPIVQPSPGDNNCECAAADTIGRLVGFKTIDFSGGNNIMDAAIIRTSEDKMSNRTLPDGYGVPLTLTIRNVTLGTKVQKYGRTTGYTKGTVTAVNSTLSIGSTDGTAIFVNQIEFTGVNGLIFGDHGDSGSLIVAADRRPVALLFGGDDVTHVAFGNPIQPILDYFKMDIDGDDVPVVIPKGKIGSSKPNSD
jgi:hypothetical protein